MLSHITGNTQTTKMDKCTWKISKDIKLTDEVFDQTEGIHLHNGDDIFYKVFRSDRRTRPIIYPFLKVTVLDWKISGRIRATNTQNYTQPTLLLRVYNSLDNNSNWFWEVEPVFYSTIIQSNKSVNNISLNTQPNHKKKDFFRLPTKMDSKEHGSTCLSAQPRLQVIERKLERDPELNVQFHKFMRKYKGLGHWNPVKSQEGKKHFSVYQPSSLEGNNFHHKSLKYYGIQQMIIFKS